MARLVTVTLVLDGSDAAMEDHEVATWLACDLKFEGMGKVDGVLPGAAVDEVQSLVKLVGRMWNAVLHRAGGEHGEGSWPVRLGTYQPDLANEALAALVKHNAIPGEEG